jgi:hypothetical protein
MPWEGFDRCSALLAAHALNAMARRMVDLTPVGRVGRSRHTLSRAAVKSTDVAHEENEYRLIDRDHLKHFITVVIDDFHRNPAGFRPIKRTADRGIQGLPSRLVDLGT